MFREPRTNSRYLIGCLVSLALSSTPSFAQFTWLGANPTLDGAVLSGSMINATGSAGFGYSSWTYGSATSGGVLTIEAGVNNIQLATTNNGSTSGPAQNFLNTNSYAWTVLSARNSTARIDIDSGAGNGSFLNLTNSADLSTYNTRLNQLFTFDRSAFIDPATGVAISPAVGSFNFTFADFNATQGYQTINLTFTPVPEPSFLLGVAALGCFAFHRLRRKKQVSTDAPVVA